MTVFDSGSAEWVRQVGWITQPVRVRQVTGPLLPHFAAQVKRAHDPARWRGPASYTISLERLAKSSRLGLCSWMSFYFYRQSRGGRRCRFNTGIDLKIRLRNFDSLGLERLFPNFIFLGCDLSKNKRVSGWSGWVGGWVGGGCRGPFVSWLNWTNIVNKIKYIICTCYCARWMQRGIDFCLCPQEARSLIGGVC